ncbi:MAG TPA: DUF4142 domain-containing protein [Longimicrobiales bacterium]|nr:DUF4142 domain-containing protein [Longimicrobiales bacterium]
MMRSRTGAQLSSLPLILALVLPGCADGQEAEPEAAAAAVPEAAPALDDATIAHVAVSANAIDADMGELALEKSRDARVRSFAETMIRDHRGVNEQAVALATRLGVTPADNDVSRSLVADAEAARARLARLSGAEFDRAYLEREVAYHQAVLDALDTTLIPNTTNDELRALLTTARGAVAAHLGHAEALGAELAGSAGGQ